MVEQVVIYMILGTILIVVLYHVGKFADFIKSFLSEKFAEYKHRKYAKEYIKKQKKIEKEVVPEKFYGLVEFEIENYNDEQSIKKDYCSIIREKIKSKYGENMQINATDKIFFNSRDFSKMDNIIDDFIKLYNYFVKINKKKEIKTNLKFSLIAKPKNINTQEVFKILSEINNLNYLNQVISNEEIYKEYKKHGLTMFNFNPRGIVRLVENDEDIELYRLIKNK